MIIRIFIIFLSISTLISCGGDKVYTPKPRMYPKIIFPARDYVRFDTSFCDMSFEIPKYASIIQDEYYFDSKPVHPCWFNIQYPNFNGTLHCSYIPINNRKHYDKLINESFKLVEEHNSKANFRQEEEISNQYGVGGLYFTLGGEVATNMQYILTDTTEHFFRASLYFNSRVSPDSIRPIYNFVKEDVDHMIETFKWKN